MNIQLKQISRLLALSVTMTGTLLAYTGCTIHDDDPRIITRVADPIIVTNVVEALKNDSKYKFDSAKYSYVQVSSYKGVVQLCGFVDNVWLQFNATATAIQIPGVRTLDNRILVNTALDKSPQMAPSDEQLSERLNTVLAHDIDYSVAQVKATSRDGIVEIGGFVDTPDQKIRAGLLVGKVDGVKDVLNCINVKDENVHSVLFPKITRMP